jgi:hypothetical protein
MIFTRRTIETVTFALLVASLPAWAQTQNPTCDAIAKMDYLGREYLPGKLRWQDYAHTPFEQQILRLRGKAIPLLIGCLADERKTKLGVWDLWPETTVGMIAFSMLWDLFTPPGDEPEWSYTMKEVITWDSICAEAPPDVVNECETGWENHLRKYGRQSIQRSWQKAWTEKKDRVYWDPAAEYFRVKKTP